MRKLKVGVLGLGSIFHRVMTDFKNAENCELYAVAARDLERAKEEAARYGAAKAYGSYEEMLNDPEVELVYIAVPHRFHKEYTIMSLKHGKHVLCEKPLAMNAEEAEEMIACAREKGLFLMEAVWTRFLPVMRKFMELKEAGEFGRIMHITADFGYDAYHNSFDPNNRIFNPELGGGALLDLGTYVIYIGAMMLGDEVISRQCSAVFASTGVDRRTLLQFEYPGNATAQFMLAVDAETPSDMLVYTEKAIVKIPMFWGGSELIINGEPVIFEKEHEGHHHEFNYIADDIRAGRRESEIMPLDESLRLIRLMDSIRKDIGLHYPTD